MIGTKIIYHLNQIERPFCSHQHSVFCWQKSLAGNRVDKHRSPIIVDRYSIKAFFENFRGEIF